MTHSLTLDLPDDIYRYLRETAALTRQTVEELVAQSVKGNLPPRIADAPAEIQNELLEMQRMSDRALREIADSQVTAESQLRHQELLTKNAEGIISLKERNELTQMREEADQLMLRKAYAWSVLRWRGYPLPAFHDLPIN